MRWNDASHVDRMTLLACRPVLGWCYAAVGGMAVLAAPLLAQISTTALLVLMGLCGVLWFCSWWQIVGRLWRQPLVLALALASVLAVLGDSQQAAGALP